MYSHQNPVIFIRWWTILVLLIATSFSVCAHSGQTDSLLRYWNNKTFPDSFRLAHLSAYAQKNMRAHPKAVITQLQKGLAVFPSNDQRQLRRKIHHQLTTTYFFNSQADSAMLHADSSEWLSIQLNDTFGLAASYGLRGLIHRIKGEHEKALNYLNQCADLMGVLGKNKQLYNIYANIGEVHLSRSNYERALHHLQQAIEIEKKVHPNGPGFPVALNNIGVLYEKQQLYAKALPYYQQSLNVHKINQDIPRVADVLNNIGVIHKKLEQPDSAIWYYRESLSQKLELGNSNKTIVTLSNMANLFLNQQQVDSALYYIQWAIRIRRDIPVPTSDDLFSYIVYGNVLTAHNQPKKAVIWSKKALDHAEKSDWNWLKREAAFSLKNAYTKLGNYQLALQYYEQYQTLSDEEKNLEKARALVQVELKNEFKQERYADSLNFAKTLEINDLKLKTQQAKVENTQLQLRFLIIILILVIILVFYGYKTVRERKKNNLQLSQLNAKILKQNQTIEQSLRKKETLLKEIHHRIKNNLQVVSSLLSLHASSLKDPRLISIFQEGQNRIETIALVHNKLYQTSDLSSVDLGEYLEELLHYIRNNYDPNHSIQLTLNTAIVPMDMDTAVPIGLVVNELITNAFKYAYPDHSGTLILELKNTTPSTVQLVIQDDGAGLPPDIEIDQTETLGLKLVRLLCLQSKADFTYSYQNGARFTLHIHSKRA